MSNFYKYSLDLDLIIIHSNKHFEIRKTIILFVHHFYYTASLLTKNTRKIHIMSISFISREKSIRITPFDFLEFNFRVYLFKIQDYFYL